MVDRGHCWCSWPPLFSSWYQTLSLFSSLVLAPAAYEYTSGLIHLVDKRCKHSLGTMATPISRCLQCLLLPFWRFSPLLHVVFPSSLLFWLPQHLLHKCLYFFCGLMSVCSVLWRQIRIYAHGRMPLLFRTFAFLYKLEKPIDFLSFHCLRHGFILFFGMPTSLRTLW